MKQMRAGKRKVWYEIAFISLIFNFMGDFKSSSAIEFKGNLTLSMKFTLKVSNLVEKVLIKLQKFSES